MPSSGSRLPNPVSVVVARAPGIVSRRHLGPTSKPRNCRGRRRTNSVLPEVDVAVLVRLLDDAPPHDRSTTQTEDVEEAETDDDENVRSNLCLLCPSRPVVRLNTLAPTGGRRWSTAEAFCIVPNVFFFLSFPSLVSRRGAHTRPIFSHTVVVVVAVDTFSPKERESDGERNLEKEVVLSLLSASGCCWYLRKKSSLYETKAAQGAKCLGTLTWTLGTGSSFPMAFQSIIS